MSHFTTKQFKALFHVGSMDPAQKGRDSLEGAGLSVSRHPEIWRKIGRGVVQGDTWRLTKEGNKFVLANSISAQFRTSIEEWALRQQLVARQRLWRVEWFDDEINDTVFVDYVDGQRKDAKQEADRFEVDLKEIPEGIVATNRLQEITCNRCDPIQVFDLILTVYAEDAGFDGVWWEDRLDVAAYSAPRGVIAPSRVREWQAYIHQPSPLPLGPTG